jgi:long-chain acyl-CoA synthetase
MAILKPTIFASVPRIYNRFYDAIKLNLSKLIGIKKILAN